MSKPVKNLIEETYKRRLAEVSDALLVSVRGIGANDNNAIRSKLHEHEIRIMVVKNLLAKRAFEGTSLESLGELVDGPSAVVYGAESAVEIAREVLKVVKKFPGLEVKGAVMDGTIFPADQVKALSKYPTRDEAQSQVIGLLIAGHQQVIGAATSTGSQLMSIVEQIAEKLEKGEPIAKAG